MTIAGTTWPDAAVGIAVMVCFTAIVAMLLWYADK